MVKQALIIAGGKGTRLGDIGRSVPKALVPVGGRPLLAHLLAWCARYHLEDVRILAGHMGDQIESFVHRHRVAGLHVSVSTEDIPLGTAGALHLVAKALHEDFLVLYGDVFVDFDPGPMCALHKERKPVATLLTRASDHPWDSHIVDVGPEGFVREFIAKREPGRLYRNLSNAAVYVCSRRVLNFIPEAVPVDFGGQVFPSILDAGEKLASWELRTPGFVKDMGTQDRLRDLEAWLEERDWIAQARQAKLPVKTVFIDRDGTLTVEREGICRPEELKLLPGAAAGVRILNEAGIRTVLVTNQSVVARGLCSIKELEIIHRKLQGDLADCGARLDAIYYSPFHPETHHAEGVLEYRRASRCRKPDVGMLMQAVRELAVDLRASILVGNSRTDIETARNAEIRSILVESPRLPAEGVQPEWHFASLCEAAKAIVDGRCNQLPR